MNRQPTPPQPHQPYTNGHYEAPLELSGVSLHRPPLVQKPTVFPVDLPLRGIGPTLYALHRFHLGGLPLSRYVAALWVVIALGAGLGVIPGRWFTMSIALLLLVAQIALGLRLRRQHYVTFVPDALPALNAVPMQPSEKLPIYATGLLNVEGRYQQYSALPGFYRTFATGEHAMLCRVAERTLLGLAAWPLEETGMWYAFVNPGDIEQVSWGKLTYGSTTYPALAVDYQLEIPPGPRRKRTEVRRETIYLATPEMADAQRIFVDLLNNLPSDKIERSFSATQSPQH